MLVASLTEAPTPERLAQLPAEAVWLEVRADLLGDLAPEAVRAADRAADAGAPRRLMYTLRSRAEGGAGPDAAAARGPRLAAAMAAGYELIDLEAERDLTPKVLAAIAPDRRLISWHGAAESATGLIDRCQGMMETPARYYKLIPGAERSGEELAPLAMLARLRRDDVVAFASGAAGLWSRPLAPRLGSPLLYGAAGGQPAAPGQPTVARLVDDFDLPRLPAATALMGVVGRPVAHSLSPRLHNGAYRQLGLPLLYLPFHATSFADFWLRVVEGDLLDEIGLPLLALSVTAPFKQLACECAGVASPLANRIDAANTLLLRDGVWYADTTDPEGVTVPLTERGVDLAAASAVVVGAGGAGRAALAGLARAGARVTVANRDAGRGEAAAELFEAEFVPLAELRPERYDVVVHATAWRSSADGPPPLDAEALAPGSRLVELVYGSAPTALVESARRRGVECIDGREVLLAQARGQFVRMTGHELPVALGRRLLGLPPEPLLEEGR